MSNTDNGGLAFPLLGEVPNAPCFNEGMTLRDWFAGHVQADDRLVKCVRAMDDKALEVFALHPDLEREEHITEVDMQAVDLTEWAALPSEVAKVARRLELEARAIARVRYMQADAMLSARTQSNGAQKEKNRG